jgi:CBS domain-containing protein
MAAVAATATPGTSVGEAHRLLREHGIHHLPVLDGDLLVGIVSQRDLLRAESDALPIRDAMSRMVFVLSPETPLSRAARVFRERRLPGAPGPRWTVARGGAPRDRRPRDGLGPGEG